ncbi:PDZ domain-containing protein, partial [Candidatus Pelagibacter bacterium]|nr:PDZ domain-containing protein [Candidatus Pelagibacter bacterium]
MNIIQNLIKNLKKDKKDIAVLGIILSDNDKLKPTILKVDETGPSYDVLRENDLILKIDGKKINNVKDFRNIQKKLKPNEIIIVRVKRRNQELNRAIRVVSLENFENPKQIHHVRFGIYFTSPFEMDREDILKLPPKII